MAGSLIGALEGIISKIEGASGRAVQQAGEYAEQECGEFVQQEVYAKYSPTEYDRTGAMGETPRITSLSRSNFKVEFVDLGNWESVKGTPFFAMIGLEGGSTWGRPPSNIMMLVSSGDFQSGIADEYAETMRAQGIPIVRK